MVPRYLRRGILRTNLYMVDHRECIRLCNRLSVLFDFQRRQILQVYKLEGIEVVQDIVVSVLSPGCPTQQWYFQ